MSGDRADRGPCLAAELGRHVTHLALARGPAGPPALGFWQASPLQLCHQQQQHRRSDYWRTENRRTGLLESGLVQPCPLRTPSHVRPACECEKTRKSRNTCICELISEFGNWYESSFPMMSMRLFPSTCSHLGLDCQHHRTELSISHAAAMPGALRGSRSGL